MKHGYNSRRLNLLFFNEGIRDHVTQQFSLHGSISTKLEPQFLIIFIWGKPCKTQLYMVRYDRLLFPCVVDTQTLQGKPSYSI